MQVSTYGDRSTRGDRAARRHRRVRHRAARRAARRRASTWRCTSFKDLPTAPAAGLVLAAVPPREDPRDALVARDGLTLGSCPPAPGSAPARPGGRPSCARSVSAWRSCRSAATSTPGCGKVAAGELDAVVLARAGLARLGRCDAVTEVLDPIQVLPAPAQGALAVECRSDDTRAAELLAALDDPATRACVAAERSLLAALEAGCSAPVGAHAELAEAEDGARALAARLGHRDRRQRLGPRLGSGPPPTAESLGRRSPPSCSTAAPPPSWR